MSSKPPWFHPDMVHVRTWEPFNDQIYRVEPTDRSLTNTWFTTHKLVSRTRPELLVRTMPNDEQKKPVKPKKTKRNRPYEAKEVEYPLRTKIVQLNPGSSDRAKLHHAFNITRKIWNECVDYYDTLGSVPMKEVHKKIDGKKVVMILPDSGKLRDDMRAALVTGDDCGTIRRSADLLAAMQQVNINIRRDIVDRFVDCVLNNYQAKRDRRIKSFKMNYFLKKNGAPSLYMAKCSLSDQTHTFYPRSLGSTYLSGTKRPMPPIEHDCRLVWDHRRDLFFLHIPVQTRPSLVPSQNVCAMDPGVRIFNTVYGSDGVAHLVGVSSVRRIVKLCRIANRMRRGIERVTCGERDSIGPYGAKWFKKSNSSKKRKKLKVIANDIEMKVKHLIKEIHCKLVNFLCRTYKTIIVPKFSTQQMCDKHKKDPTKPRRKINKRTAFIMARWSHYAFRERLIAKGKVEGCNVVVGTEEYTSKTCSACFNVKDNLGRAIKYNCLNCGAKMHRDVNAARNILVRNWEQARLYHKRRPVITKSTLR
jgi:hypothetical protein